MEKFTYLGCLNTYDLDSKKEILVKIAKATAALSAMDKIWKSTSIHKKLKLEVLKTCVFSGMLYGVKCFIASKIKQKYIICAVRNNWNNKANQA